MDRLRSALRFPLAAGISLSLLAPCGGEPEFMKRRPVPTAAWSASPRTDSASDYRGYATVEAWPSRDVVEVRIEGPGPYAGRRVTLRRNEHTYLGIVNLGPALPVPSLEHVSLAVGDRVYVGFSDDSKTGPDTYFAGVILRANR